MLELKKALPEKLELVVIGSDEVFNFAQKSKWGFTTQLFGDVDADKVASYAGSFGFTTLQDIKESGVKNEIKFVLSKMTSISVRDNHSAEIINALTGQKPFIHLDPVLIYDFSKELCSAKNPFLKNYIIVYSYQDRIADKKEIETIRNFAKKQGKKLVSIFCTYRWCDRGIMPKTPFDVLAWFKYADYIITDTFHGTIFSIINQKKFCSLIRETNKEKLGYLLSSLHLSDRIVETPYQIESTLLKEVNYNKTNNLLSREKKISKEYLVNVLSL